MTIELICINEFELEGFKFKYGRKYNIIIGYYYHSYIVINNILKLPIEQIILDYNFSDKKGYRVIKNIDKRDFYHI